MAELIETSLDVSGVRLEGNRYIQKTMISFAPSGDYLAGTMLITFGAFCFPFFINGFQRVAILASPVTHTNGLVTPVEVINLGLVRGDSIYSGTSTTPVVLTKEILDTYRDFGINIIELAELTLPN